MIRSDQISIENAHDYRWLLFHMGNKNVGESGCDIFYYLTMCYSNNKVIL